MKTISELLEFGLSDIQVHKIKLVFNEYPEIEKAFIYGSRAKGNFSNASDIDITLFGNQLNASIQQKIEADLDDLLIAYKIDLSIFSKIKNEELINHIRRVGKVFFTRV